MKGAVSALLTLLLMFTFAATASAAVAPDVWGLYEYWETHGYPDDVGGVYCDNITGGLVITLVGADQSRREEILAMVENPAGLGFGESKYDYNAMLAVQQEIVNEMSGGGRIYGVGVGWGGGEGEATGFGESGKEFRVVVTVDESAFAEYTRTYAARYGDMVAVAAGDPVVLDGYDCSETVPGPGGARLLHMMAVAAAVLVVLAALFLNRRRLVPVLQVTGGATAAIARPLSRQEVIRAVRESALSPSPAVQAKLLKQIDR